MNVYALLVSGAFTTYLFAKITPMPPKTTPSSKQETKKNREMTDANKESDNDLIKLIIEQSISRQLKNSTQTAKKKALQIGKFGFPSYSNLRFLDSYCASINYFTSTPNWSGEVITKQDLEKAEGIGRQKSYFKEDESVPTPFRSLNNDYWGSGYSRGHLVPAGDFNSIQINKDLTFILSSNIVPQSISMNSCDWFRIEQFARKLIKNDDNDIKQCWIFR